MLDETHIISIISDQLDRVFGLFTIILAFMARKRIHNLLSSTKGSVTWFQGFFTFFFTALYFNYKINKIYESEITVENFKEWELSFKIEALEKFHCVHLPNILELTFFGNKEVGWNDHCAISLRIDLETWIPELL